MYMYIFSTLRNYAKLYYHNVYRLKYRVQQTLIKRSAEFVFLFFKYHNFSVPILHDGLHTKSYYNTKTAPILQYN